MDALKFAFEILIVGALALPWLAILIQMLSREKETSALRSFLSVVPLQARDAVAVALIIAIGYLAGSAVSRVSRNFFNDELWGSLPTEQQIRSSVYYDEYCTVDVLAFLDAPTEFTEKKHSNLPEWLCNQVNTTKVGDVSERVNATIRPEVPKGAADGGQPPGSGRTAATPPLFQWSALVEEMFRLQESKLLLSGEDRTDRLKQYYDQITVLRGAAFNGFILFVVCTFGIFGHFKVRWSHPSLKAVTFLPAIILILLGVVRFWNHWQKNSDTLYTDPPLAELVLFLLGAVGFFIVLQARDAKNHFPTWAMAAALTAVSFGGWWWTEVMYDLQVIHSVPELAPNVPDRNPG